MLGEDDDFSYGPNHLENLTVEQIQERLGMVSDEVLEQADQLGKEIDELDEDLEDDETEDLLDMINPQNTGKKDFPDNEPTQQKKRGRPKHTQTKDAKYVKKKKTVGIMTPASPTNNQRRIHRTCHSFQNQDQDCPLCKGYPPRPGDPLPVHPGPGESVQISGVEGFSGTFKLKGDLPPITPPDAAKKLAEQLMAQQVIPPIEQPKVLDDCPIEDQPFIGFLLSKWNRLEEEIEQLSLPITALRSEQKYLEKLSKEFCEEFFPDESDTP